MRGKGSRLGEGGKELSWVSFGERGRVKAGFHRTYIGGGHSPNVMGQLHMFHGRFGEQDHLCRFDENPPPMYIQ